MNGPSRFFASICVALVIAVSTAALHADTDPANDNSVGAEALNLTPGTATLEFGALVDQDDVDYWRVDLPARSALTVVVTPLEEEFDEPDVAVFILDTDGSTVLLLDDDDQAVEDPTDEQTGSTARFRPDTAGTYFVVVSGCCTIVGNHDEVGPYAMFASLALENAPATDIEPANDAGPGAEPFLVGVAGFPVAEVQVAELSPPARGGGSGDIDLFVVDLLVGDSLVAVTTPLAGLPSAFDQPNTELALVDPGGNTVLISDDGGSDQPGVLNRGSVLRYLAQESGRHYLVVSGDDDENQGAVGVLDGAHAESGRYALTAAALRRPRSPLEVPVSAWPGRLLLIGALAGLGLAWTRRP